MIDIDLLLMPIRADAPAGDDLRYNPVYDQINEARAEDDPTLPTGSWARQPKRADLPLVLRLTREALIRRSKDLWLAVWLGHAELVTEGIGALPTVLRLLLALQEQFPETLHPEVEEGDTGARSAPLQWGLEQYAGLVAELPSVAPGVSYHTYKATRLGTSTEATESLDAALASTEKVFFAEAEAVLAEARRELEPLYLYCEHFYGDEGPSFAKLRRTVEEVHSLVTGLLRERREVDPDPPGPPPAEPAVQEPAQAQESPAAAPKADIKPAPQDPASLSPRNGMETLVVAPRETVATMPLPSPHFVVETAPTTEPGPVVPQTRAEAMAQIASAARFLAEKTPADPTGYVLLATQSWADVLVHGQGSTQAPSSELRLQLRTLRREKRWGELLHASLAALGEANSTQWLDVHRDVWLAATHTGAALVAASVVAMVRQLLASGAAMDDCFEDETPIATDETCQWIVAEGMQEPEYSVAEEEAPIPAKEEGLRVQDIVESNSQGVPLPLDLFAQASDLASSGDVQGAVALLMADGEASAARRKRFFRRLEIAKLCLASGFEEIARRVLEGLRLELAECGVMSWEGPEAGAEVLYLLLQCRDADGTTDPAGQAEMMAELCALDPLRALQLQEGR